MQVVKETLTIDAAGTDSDEYSNPSGLGHSQSITILAPAALTGTVTVQVAEEPGGTFRTVQFPPGTDLEIPAGKAITLTGLAALAIRVHSSGAEAAERVFHLMLQQENRR